MSVLIKSSNGEEYHTSNGEFRAILAVAHAFGIIPNPWNNNHDCGITMNCDQLEELSVRLKQVGEASEIISILGDNNGSIGIS
jgi:hypothetical protein